MQTPTKELSKNIEISQSSIDNIRSFLQICLNEVWLIKRREELSDVGEENLRVIGVNIGRVSELLPGGDK